MNNNNTKTKICKNWQQTGGCHYGPKCHFLHPNQKVQKQNKQPVVCDFFLQGNCTYGNKCHNLHSTPDQSEQTSTPVAQTTPPPVLDESTKTECVEKIKTFIDSGSLGCCEVNTLASKIELPEGLQIASFAEGFPDVFFVFKKNSTAGPKVKVGLVKRLDSMIECYALDPSVNEVQLITHAAPHKTNVKFLKDRKALLSFSTPEEAAEVLERPSEKFLMQKATSSDPWVKIEAFHGKTKEPKPIHSNVHAHANGLPHNSQKNIKPPTSATSNRKSKASLSESQEHDTSELKDWLKARSLSQVFDFLRDQGVVSISLLEHVERHAIMDSNLTPVAKNLLIQQVEQLVISQANDRLLSSLTLDEVDVDIYTNMEIVDTVQKEWMTFASLFDVTKHKTAALQGTGHQATQILVILRDSCIPLKEILEKMHNIAELRNAASKFRQQILKKYSKK